MKQIYYLLVLLFSFGIASAQEKLSKEEKERREKNIQAGNPFARFGYKAKVATLSKGKYLEVHDLDSIVTIGTIRWHVDKQQIVGNIVVDTLNPDHQPIGDITGRWISPDPLSEEFPSWSPYNFVFNNPLRYTDPDGQAPVDWIRDRYGNYLWDSKATNQSNTRQGWDYVGKSLPQGTQRLQILTEIDGELYHKHTNNSLASLGNKIFGENTFVEHKAYDPVGDNNLREGINNGVGMVVGGLAFKGLSKAYVSVFSSNVTKTGLNIGDDFLNSATQSTGNQGLTNVGRALQKHAGREGSVFENVGFSHKTANQDGLNIINNIMSTNSKNLLIQPAKQGGTEVYNTVTGQGFAISRNGLFNGFRELPKQ